MQTFSPLPWPSPTELTDESKGFDGTKSIPIKSDGSGPVISRECIEFINKSIQTPKSITVDSASTFSTYHLEGSPRYRPDWIIIIQTSQVTIDPWVRKLNITKSKLVGQTQWVKSIIVCAEGGQPDLLGYFDIVQYQLQIDFMNQTGTYRSQNDHCAAKRIIDTSTYLEPFDDDDDIWMTGEEMNANIEALTMIYEMLNVILSNKAKGLKKKNTMKLLLSFMPQKNW